MQMRRWGRLAVDFVGERHELRPTREFSFGRGGDLQIDTGFDLPTTVGTFVHENGIWWLHNEMASIDIHLLDSGSRSAVLIAPGSFTPLGFERSVLRVVVGPTTYELLLECESVDADVVIDTRGPTAPSLNLEQRQLLTALAEGRLRGNTTAPIPSNADVADRLEWRITKLNRKLDHLCIKFDKLGVAGLRGTARRLATDRRRRLVEYCVATGVITADDLDLLPSPFLRPHTSTSGVATPSS